MTANLANELRIHWTKIRIHNTFVLNYSTEWSKATQDYRPCANLKLQYMYLIIFSKPVSIIQWRHYITFHSHVLMTSASQHHKKNRYGRLLFALSCVYIRACMMWALPQAYFRFQSPPYQWGRGRWFPLRQSSSVYPRVRDFSMLTEPASDRTKGKNTRRIYNDRRTDFLSSLLGNTFLGKAVEGELRGGGGVYALSQLRF